MQGITFAGFVRTLSLNLRIYDRCNEKFDRMYQKSKLTARWCEGGPFGGPFVALFLNQGAKRKWRPSPRTNNWQLTHAGLTHTYGSSANTIPAHIFPVCKFLSADQSRPLTSLQRSLADLIRVRYSKNMICSISEISLVRKISRISIIYHFIF